MKNLLTIAGTDPSGAAGIQADLQTFRDHGHHGLSCVTAVIAQNTSGVGEWVAVEPKLLEAQLAAVFADIRVDAVKIGMVPTVSSVRVIAEALHGRKIPIVLDPVLASGDGATALVREGTTEAMLELLVPHATVVTPNSIEASVLALSDTSDTPIAELAKALSERFSTSFLVKAGHASHDGDLVDVLGIGGEVIELQPHKRIPFDVRGTGCHLSSAIACRLASGDELVAAIEASRTYLASLLHERRSSLGKGRHVLLHVDPA